jgi:hypothetical protein
LNCGNAGAPDQTGNGTSGRDVCAILATSDPSHTNDGVPNSYGGSCSGGAQLVTCASQGQTFISGTCAVNNTYGCGRPNVFQGQLGTPAVAGQTNAVTWLGVPLDPPGTTTNRTIRITNIRADAHDANSATAPGNFFASYIQAQISINGNTSLSLNNPQQIVAFVGPGLLIAAITTNPPVYLQCTTANTPAPAFRWTEGFASSWKAKNIAMILNSTSSGYTGNGTVLATASYWSYDGTTTAHPLDFNQNVPGAIYNTESGFMYPGTPSLDSSPIDPTANTGGNPPFGLGTVQVTSTSLALHNGTGIDNAGIADSGTRLEVLISNVPLGANVSVPEAISLTNSAGVSGIALLVTTNSSGAGTYSPVYTGNSASAALAAQSTLPVGGGMAVYEVLFADPFSVESATLTATVTWSLNLNLNQPTPGQFAQASGGFAPFYPGGAANLPSSTLPIPRFVQATANVGNFFEFTRCACNLLFPYVTNAGGYDTGLAIANTSMDNLTPGAKAQFGGVQLWYYGGIPATGGAAPPTQCTNVASPGTCPTPNATSSSSAIGQVPAGQVLTYVLSTSGGGIGNGANGLAPNWAAGFQGYMIAQTQFQYCHAYAFITAAGAGPLSTSISEGYLGLQLDNAIGLGANLPSRTGQLGESLAH